MTVGDLAATWEWMESAEAFILKGGSVEWESASFGKGRLVRIERLESSHDRWPKHFVRYVNPEIEVAELISNQDDAQSTTPGGHDG